jgi:hypothetical protein
MRLQKSLSVSWRESLITSETVMYAARLSLIVSVIGLSACTSDQEAQRARPTGNPAHAEVSPVRLAQRAAPTTASLEQLVVDLDGDGRPDSVIVQPPRDTGDAGAVGAIQLVLSRTGRHTLTGPWDSPPHDFSGVTNLVRSRFLYIADFQRAGRLLFLFGPEYGCCAQGFSIYRVGRDSVERYLAEEEFIFRRPIVPSSHEVTTLVGVRGLTEEDGGRTAEFPKASSYAPILAIRLEEMARLDTASTARLTQEELGGFAGVDRSDRYRAVRRADGSRAVWDDSTQQVVP